MKTITLYLCLAFACVSYTMHGQEKDSIQLKKEQTKRYLESRLEIIKADEKILLKYQIEKINKKLEDGKITTEEAERQKKKAAQLTAATIEYRLAKEKRELLTDYYIQEGGSFIRFGEVFDTRKIKKRPFRKDIRTYSDIVFAVGFNNAIQDGISLSDSDYKTGGSRFFELGISWRTRVFKDHNFVRFKYGLFKGTAHMHDIYNSKTEIHLYNLHSSAAHAMKTNGNSLDRKQDTTTLNKKRATCPAQTCATNKQKGKTQHAPFTNRNFRLWNP